MTNILIMLLLISGPVSFLITSLYARKQPGLRPHRVKALSIRASLISLFTAAISGFFVMQNGAWHSPLLGFEGLGISVRLDALSVLMLTMIGLLSFFILRFSLNYLDGDARQGAFLGRLAASFAAVQLLVVSANLALLLATWVLSSIALHRLLLYYPERPGARMAARKKFVMARCSDLMLLLAGVLLYLHFGTGDLEELFNGLKAYTLVGELPAMVEWAGVFLASAALFKSAQFPTHGWLIEVMETPTPVSALLHAGLLNAGPFLMIRFAWLLEAGTYGALLLMTVGSITALYGSVVYMTQPSVKTALGYSSIAHMGFSLMVCGFGAYAAAMLHLVAHSFYKAHAFLSSGSTAEVLRAARVQLPQRRQSLLRILGSMALALGFYLLMAEVWGVDLQEEFTLFLLGSLIVLGMTRLIAGVMDAHASLQLHLRMMGISALLVLSFFVLESGMQFLLETQIPQLSAPSGMVKGIMVVIGLVFAVTVAIQILSPYLPGSAFTERLAVHCRNGFYIGALTDRFMGAWQVKQPVLQYPVAVADRPYAGPAEEPARKRVYEEQFS